MYNNSPLLLSHPSAALDCRRNNLAYTMPRVLILDANTFYIIFYKL